MQELLIEVVLQHFSSAPLKVLELGTGSGAIACALQLERPTWQMSATDISANALAIASENAKMHNLNKIKFYLGDWAAAIPAEQEKFNLIMPKSRG